MNNTMPNTTSPRNDLLPDLFAMGTKFSVLSRTLFLPVHLSVARKKTRRPLHVTIVLCILEFLDDLCTAAL